jgi:hypothetical protein
MRIFRKAVLPPPNFPFPGKGWSKNTLEFDFDYGDEDNTLKDREEASSKELGTPNVGIE